METTYIGEPRTYGKTELSYNDYLKVPELLGLQTPLSRPEHHDELLFIVIHQAYELWFKLVLHELEQARVWMTAGKPLRARHFVNRVVEIFRVLVGQIHVLETMDPVDFLQFRDRLSPASGFQSMQFRELEFLCGMKDARYFQFFGNRPDLLAILRARFEGPDLRGAYLRMLERMGYEGVPGDPRAMEGGDGRVIEILVELYQEPAKKLELYLLTESLVSLDQGLAHWREHHVRVVERLIGNKQGTGGSSGVGYLRATAEKKAFPVLWEVRGHLKKAPATES